MKRSVVAMKGSVVAAWVRATGSWMLGDDFLEPFAPASTVNVNANLVNVRFGVPVGLF